MGGNRLLLCRGREDRAMGGRSLLLASVLMLLPRAAGITGEPTAAKCDIPQDETTQDLKPGEGCIIDGHAGSEKVAEVCRACASLQTVDMHTMMDKHTGRALPQFLPTPLCFAHIAGACQYDPNDVCHEDSRTLAFARGIIKDQRSCPACDRLIRLTTRSSTKICVSSRSASASPQRRERTCRLAGCYVCYSGRRQCARRRCLRFHLQVSSTMSFR